MSWFAVPNLVEGRDQLNARFPNREKGAEGFVGDKPHQNEPSSHNPDKTSKPEFKDGDAKDEVRAWDADKDLRDPSVTMEQVVQHIITLARSGVLWWIRYVIYNGRIWHRRDEFVTRVYTGKNKHTDHTHINSDFTQEADEVRNTNWRFQELGAAAPKPPAVPEGLKVDGQLGPKTIRRWQEIMGTKPDGVISDPSELVKAVQRKLNATVGAGLKVDGRGIKQDGHRYLTVAALQRYLKSPVDQVMSVGYSHVVAALQRRLNAGWF